MGVIKNVHKILAGKEEEKTSMYGRSGSSRKKNWGPGCVG
jgi:hypothetical protein